MSLLLRLDRDALILLGQVLWSTTKTRTNQYEVQIGRESVIRRESNSIQYGKFTYISEGT